jgi:DNA topoisomerase-1
MKIGDPLIEKGVSAECKFTQAAPRYSEATLVKKLEELGIGRPSTYAPTISTLTTGRGYIFKGDVEGRKVPVTNLTLKGGVVATAAKTETVGAERGKLIPQEIGIVVSDYLVENFPRIMDYDFTADVEQDFDRIAEGKLVWNEVIASFYGDFHKKVDASMHDGQYTHVERVLGTDPADGKTVVARFGQFGAYVQKGEGEDKQSASLAKGQLIETLTLEEALKLLEFPRRVGSLDGVDIQVLKGRYGPYIKYGDKNISLPRGADPLRISQEECIRLVQDAVSGASATPVIREFEAAGISVLNGRYGPYIKYDGRNFRIPRGTDAAALTEEDCRRIIDAAPAADASAKPRRFKKSK